MTKQKETRCWRKYERDGGDDNDEEWYCIVLRTKYFHLLHFIYSVWIIYTSFLVKWSSVFFPNKTLCFVLDIDLW